MKVRKRSTYRRFYRQTPPGEAGAPSRTPTPPPAPGKRVRGRTGASPHGHEAPGALAEAARDVRHPDVPEGVSTVGRGGGGREAGEAEKQPFPVESTHCHLEGPRTVPADQVGVGGKGAARFTSLRPATHTHSAAISCSGHPSTPSEGRRKGWVVSALTGLSVSGVRPRRGDRHRRLGWARGHPAGPHPGTSTDKGREEWRRKVC